MSVGSVGRDGHHCIDGVNCSNTSMTGGNIDFSAPGTDSLVYTLDLNGGYTQRDGTSFATPHISGAVALMMSYRNNSLPNWNNMVHEDCEAILQRTSTDISQSYPYQERVGWDTVSGFGKINISRAIREINKDYFRFRHITEAVGVTSSSRAVQTITTNAMMKWPAFNGYNKGVYSTNVYELTTTLNYVLLPTETIIDSWPLHKESYGTRNLYDTLVVIDRPFHSEIVSVSATQAVLKTFYYRFNPTSTYMPYLDPLDHKNAITLYTYDSSGSVGIEKDSKVETTFKIYPNPSSGLFSIYFTSTQLEQHNYSVFNVLGQEVLNGTFKAEFGKNLFELNASNLSNGVYILNIFGSNKKLHSQKIVKN